MKKRYPKGYRFFAVQAAQTTEEAEIQIFSFHCAMMAQKEVCL